MSQLLLLVKNDLRGALDRRKVKDNTIKSISFLGFVSFVGLVSLFLSCFYNYSFVTMCQELNVDVIYAMLMMGGLSSMMVFMTAIVRAKGIFMGKDYEMLRSMPIKKRDIVLSKIIGLYLLELIYCSIALIPNGVICLLLTGKMVYLFTSLLVVVLLPWFPIVLGCLFGLFVALVADKSKWGNVITMVMYALFFVVLFGFSYLTGFNAGETGSMVTDVQALSYISWLDPTLVFVRMAFTSHFAWIFAFVASNVLALGIAVALITSLYDKVYQIANTMHSGHYVRKSLKIRGLFTTLFKNEAKRYFSSRLYCINTMMSGIMTLVLVVLALIPANGDAEYFSYLQGLVFCIPLVMFFSLGMSTPASVSVSMEGDTFWHIKSMPIPSKLYAKVKIAFSTALLSVFSLITSLIIVIWLRVDALMALYLIVEPLVFIVGASSLGYVINLLYPKMKWKSEAEVVKNSSAVIFSMLIDIALALVFGTVTLILGFAVAPWLAMIATSVLTMIFSVGMYSLALGVSDKLIRKIN